MCNALALLQCIASHEATRKAFLEAKIPLYLYPFLHTGDESRPFEYLRLTSLGVLGALVKTDESEVGFWVVPDRACIDDGALIGSEIPAYDRDHPALPAHNGGGNRVEVDPAIIVLFQPPLTLAHVFSRTVATFIVQKILLDDIGRPPHY